MARDTFVWWMDEAPPVAEVESALRQYGEGLFTGMEWERGRFYVKLPGQARRVDESVGRWFEVYPDDDSLDVITRSMDPITNAIARGFAELAALRWKGRLE
jgi:hypothetical protein